MAMLLGRQHRSVFGEFRYEPTTKRVRVRSGGRLLADTRHAVLIWEPKRIVPSYAVPAGDVLADLKPADPDVAAEEHPEQVERGGPPILSPTTPFAVHSSEGEPLTLVADGIEFTGAGFRPADPDLAGYVVLDFFAFDEWLEEDEVIVGHPRDPFKRIDVRASSDHIVLELDGVVLADTTRAKILFETHLPMRYYLPVEDVRTEFLRKSETRTRCAYKGVARYWSIELPGTTVADACWTYEQPLSDAVDVRDMVAFFNEFVDITRAGVPEERPVTPWSRKS
jgi:uncharacterized protein (DUF427 family)